MQNVSRLIAAMHLQSPSKNFMSRLGKNVSGGSDVGYDEHGASLVAQMVKNPPDNAGDPGSIPESGRCPGAGNGSPLQCPCPGNPMDRGAWLAAVPGVTKSRTRLSD